MKAAVINAETKLTKAAGRDAWKLAPQSPVLAWPELRALLADPPRFALDNSGPMPGEPAL